ncbi:MAG: cytochrome c3 family protein [Deltaproteobacteria bacterium]|nr:cytochrome c3 family protein [Deltaproteobacteria bacterium]
MLGASFCLLGAGSVAFVTHKEQNNTFCVSCHLPDRSGPLHGQKFQRFMARPPVDLTAAHQAKARTKCIDCHGGVGVVERAQVLGVAAWDTLRYLADRYKEPEGMRLPLGDADCRWCHTDLDKRAAQAREEEQDYHKIFAHLTVKLRCAQCHVSHVEGLPTFYSMRRETVLPLCKRCHPQIGETL